MDASPDNVSDGNGSVESLHEFVRLLAERNRQLQTALDSRIVIEQAKGVLIERFDLQPQQAFDLLQRASRSQRRKIHDVAAEIVSSRNTPPAVQAAASSLRLDLARG
jgi:AmiR/NasT family two-component response regulator